MKCLENMNRITVPTDMLLDMMKLYRCNGKELYYENLFKKDMDAISEEIVEKETYFFAKIANVQLTEQRLKLLTTKNHVAKNKDEMLVNNAKAIFSALHNNIKDFELIPLECESMAKKLYKGICTMKYKTSIVVEKDNLLVPSRKKQSKADDIAALFDKFKVMFESDEYESTLLIVNFFTDFYMTKPFEENNELVSYLFLYIFLFHFGFEQFKYTSFFEKIYLDNKFKTFEQAILQATYNWEAGYGQTQPLHRFIIEIMQANYKEIEHKAKSYSFESTLKKTDDVEGTILKWPTEIFSKADIQKLHPYVSSSTLDRTLKRLRDEGKIQPMGTGRSAKWLKRYTLERGFNVETISFNFGDTDDKKKK